MFGFQSSNPRLLDFSRKIISSKPIKEKTLQEYKRIHDKIFAKYFSSAKIKSVSRTDIKNFHKSVGKLNGEYMANRALELLHSIFNEAMEDEDIRLPRNPCRKIERFEEPPCNRYLCDEELHRLLLAIWQLPTYFKNYFILLLYIGARGGNVKSMQWNEVDLDAQKWIIPAKKAKGKKKIVLQLSDVSIICLQEMQKISGNSQFVFPAKSKSGHLEEPKKRWYEACKNAGIEDCTMHTLRATFATHLDELGIPTKIVSHMLGHTDTKTTEVYLRSKRKEKEEAKKAKEAVSLVAKHFDSLIEKVA